MNTQQLECFVRVAEKLNFTRAAEELCISAPAVTHHIKNLEEELNTALFIRTPKMVKLTEAGALFYGEARDILEKMAIAEKKVKRFASQKLTRLRIGCSSQTELACLSGALMKLKETFPQACPQLIIQDYCLLRTLFANRQLDVLIGTREMAENLPDCIFKRARNIESYVLVREDSPLSALESVSFCQLKDIPLIALHPRLIPFQYGNRLQEFITLHSQGHFHLLCENDQSAVLLASCGYGAAILPEIYIPSPAAGLSILPFSEEQSPVEYGAAYHRERRDGVVREFVGWVLEEALSKRYFI